MSAALSIEFAERRDVPEILAFIRALAEYEKLSHEVVATEAALEATLFCEHPVARVLLARWNGAPAGFALFFRSYSTFLARPGIYLEDLFVNPELRGKGIGKALLKRLAQHAVETGAGRLEWSVLDWNKPAIDFYRSLGAVPMEEWTVFRLTGAALGSFAGCEAAQTRA